MSLKCTMILGDCLTVLPLLPSRRCSLAFADIPYAPKTTHCTRNAWDKHICLNSFRNAAWSAITPEGQLLMTANARLFGALISAWPKYFRYDLVWKKKLPVGFLDANRRPLRLHELIAVFAKGLGTYNPQKVPGRPYVCRAGRRNNTYDGHRALQSSGADRFPVSVIEPEKKDMVRLHPTQKPLALLNWLIRTYSNPGDHVLDPVSGSFTTCVSACLNGRHSVGIERDAQYFEAGVERVRKTVVDNKLDVAIEVRR